MGNRLRVLLIDDDEDEYILTRRLLSDRSYMAGGRMESGYQLDWVDTYEAGLQAIAQHEHDVYLVDYRLGERDGLDLVREVSKNSLAAPIIVMTGQGNYDVDVEAMKMGAMDYLVKADLTAPLLERTIRYAIERKRAEAAIRAHAARAELLARLSQAFAEAGLDYATVLDTIAERTAALTGDACLIRMQVDENRWSEAVASSNAGEDILSALRSLCASDSFSAAYELDAEHELPWEGRTPIQSTVIVPLRIHNRTMGTFGVLSFQAGRIYSQNDVAFFQDLADRAAMAIENARLYDLEEKRAAEMDALGKATAALLSTINLEELLGEILDAAQSAIPAAERGMLHLVAPETGTLQVRAVSGFRDARIQKTIRTRSKDFFAKALQERAPMIIFDTQDDPNYSAEVETGELKLIRSVIVAPLSLGNEVLGVISLSANQPNAFKEADLNLLVSFATTTTAAIQNAMLHAEVQRWALTDGLTQIYNRRGFFLLGEREVDRVRRFDHPLSAIMLDLDNFKEINDTFGHPVGDQVLRILAERLRTSIREVDIIGRYGGDEFAVLLPETDLFTACAVAERLRQQISEQIDLPFTDGQNISLEVTASMGVSNVVRDTQDLDELLARADKAMYRSKSKGRNRVEVA